MLGNNYLLWEDDRFIIKTPFNPHIAYEEGLHVIVATKTDLQSAWEDPRLAGDAFELASRACKIMNELELAPWFNLQANGNWNLLPGKIPFFHIHIYGRNKTANWAKPVLLPEAPGTYSNRPMPKADQQKLIAAFEEL